MSTEPRLRTQPGSVQKCRHLWYAISKDWCGRAGDNGQSWFTSLIVFIEIMGHCSSSKKEKAILLRILYNSFNNCSCNYVFNRKTTHWKSYPGVAEKAPSLAGLQLDLGDSALRLISLYVSEFFILRILIFQRNYLLKKISRCATEWLGCL